MSNPPFNAFSLKIEVFHRSFIRELTMLKSPRLTKSKLSPFEEWDLKENNNDEENNDDRFAFCTLQQ